MKKLLSVVIALTAALGMSAFAAPVLDTAESAVENTNDVAVLAANYEKSLKPGLNMVGATTSAWNFEEADGMNSVSMFSGAGRVVDNPLSDGVNSSAKVYGESHTTAGFPGVVFKLSEQMDGARPVYVAFKYYKTYTPAADETGKIAENLWVMKNGSTYKAKDINGFLTGKGWKQFSSLINFNAAFNAGNSSDINKDPIKTITILAKTEKNDGYTNFYYDDITFVPSYKIEYVANDGTEDVVATKYALLDGVGKFLTKYYVDDTISYEREGYKFCGWATSADATVGVTTVALANEDITLYAVWEKLPETIGWDFEDPSKSKWDKSKYALEYRNGRMVLDNSKVNSGYIGHNNFTVEDGIDASKYSYLVFKARSLGNVDSIKFYFNTTTSGWTEDATVTFRLTPNSKEFTEYVVDMSSNPDWKGYYVNCMMQLNNGTGAVEFEDIYFATDVEKRFVWDFNGTKDLGVSPWGHSTVSYENGLLKVVRKTTDSTPHGAVDISTTSYITNSLKPSVNASENLFVVFKSPKNRGPESIQCYYITGEMTGITGSGFVTGYLTCSDGLYDYYVIDFTPKASDYAKGMIKKFSFATNDGTYYFDEIYVTNKAPVITKPANADLVSKYVRCWGSYSLTNENGVYVAKQNTTAHGGLYVTPSNSYAEQNRYFVVKLVNALSTGKPGNFYPVGAYKSGIDGNLYMGTYTSEYTTGDGAYTYYIYDTATADKNANDGIAYTGKVGQCCLTASGGQFAFEAAFFTNNLDAIYSTNTVATKLISAPSEITKDLGTAVVAPYLEYADGKVFDFTYSVDNENATIEAKADGTAVLTAKRNGKVIVTATANDAAKTTLTKEVTISGQADIYTINYDANTTDAVTGMPESTEVRSFERNVALSDAVPVREGYTFVGWAPTDAYYIIDSYTFSGDTTAVTLKAIWADYDYALFPVEKNSIEGSVYVNGIWYNSSDVKFYGGSIIVDLTDGIGYIYITGETVEDTEYYMVTAAGASAMDFTPAKTLAYNEVRATGNTGIRFKATVAHQMRLATKENNGLETAEYGFIVSTENQISDADGLDLYLVDDGLAVKGVAYNKAAGIDKYVDETDEGVVMAAVLTGVAPSKKNYETTIYVRPYIVLESGLVVYGTATGDTYYNIAKTIAADMPEDAPYAEYINGIIATCAE